ncbi:FUSC family protein [Streptomyces chilikensis]|uniref:FUSC family protein n=1 Tax=Streptomyces chilikensis TaxID=1194079 RepID=UPI00140823F9|nr:FUSC family protein [Streptomyces chilikensis]
MNRATEVIGRELRAVGVTARNAVRGPGRERDLMVQSLKASVAALLAWTVAKLWLEDPMALMAPWAALVLVQATVYGSLLRAAQQCAAICVGTLLASAAQAVTGDELAAMAVCLPPLMLLAQWSRFGDQGNYAATTAVFTLATGAVSAQAAGHRVGQAVLGAVIGVAVNALVLPPVHLRDVRDNLVGLAAEAGAVLRRVAGDLTRAEWDDSAAARWSRATDRLERRLEGLRSARGWSDESLRLAPDRLRRLRRIPPNVPSAEEDERWARVTGQVVALTRALSVAADADRSPLPPDGAALERYAGMLEVLGLACEAESRRLASGPVGATRSDLRRKEARAASGPRAPEGPAASPEPDPEPDPEPSEERLTELHAGLREHLREHAARNPSQAAVLGALLLHAENIWADTALGARRE